MNTSILEICRRYSSLSEVQIHILQHSEEILQFASDLSRREIQLFVPGKKPQSLVSVAWRTPFSRQSSMAEGVRVGCEIAAYEEPAVWQVLQQGCPLHAGREVQYGKIESLAAYPFADNAGSCIAAVVFFGNVEVSRESLTETAYWALQVPQEIAARDLYRPLTVQEGVVVVDGNGVITYADEMAVGILHLRGHIGGLQGFNIYNAQRDFIGAKRALATAKGYMDEVLFQGAVFTRRVLPLLQHGKVRQIVSLLAERTELHHKEAELLVKTSVIKEIHHRVKNNLQTIAGLLRMQSRRAHNEETKMALNESVQRILSISFIHEILARQDAETVDVAAAAQQLLTLAVRSMAAPERRIETVFRGESLYLSSGRATSVALILNELITNALVHGFGKERSGTLSVSVQAKGEQVEVSVTDTGCGMPPGSDRENPAHLGLEIVRTLIETDLHGQWRIAANMPQGTRVTVRFLRQKEDRDGISHGHC